MSVLCVVKVVSCDRDVYCYGDAYPSAAFSIGKLKAASRSSASSSRVIILSWWSCNGRYLSFACLGTMNLNLSCDSAGCCSSVYVHQHPWVVVKGEYLTSTGCPLEQVNKLLNIGQFAGYYLRPDF